ncbi:MULTISPECIES: DUF1402 family protein [Xanthobacter]|uniref:DUF1402 family protein n=1 Tax=Xanthobacter TaxID=279 RepID=UPI003727CA36
MRTRAFATTYEEKCEKIVALLARDHKLMHQVRQVAKVYALTPSTSSGRWSGNMSTSSPLRRCAGVINASMTRLSAALPPGRGCNLSVVERKPLADEHP